MNHSNLVLICVVAYVTIAFAFWLVFGYFNRRRTDKEDKDRYQ